MALTKRASGDRKSTSFKVLESLHRDLKIAAAKEGREMRELVEDALKAYLRTHSAAK
jgi:hypothetical protein